MIKEVNLPAILPYSYLRLRQTELTNPSQLLSCGFQRSGRKMLRYQVEPRWWQKAEFDPRGPR